MTKIGAVFSVGATEGGCTFAIQHILKRETNPIDVFLFYGEPAPGQARSPIEAVNSLRSNSFGGRIQVILSTATDAYSLDRTYTTALELMQDIRGRGYDRIYLGITGATNPMVAALFHAGMAELHGEVIPIYVQGKETQSVEFIASPHTRDAITIGRILHLADRAQLSVAAQVAKDLSGGGWGGFVREATLGLAEWDDFQYEEAAKRLGKLKEIWPHYEHHESLGALADTVGRYIEVATGIAGIEKCYSNLDIFQKQASTAQWKERVLCQGKWIPLDALANGRRRISEHRYADCVLRAYRAVETAIQFRLFSLGIHPSYLDWSKPPLESIKGGAPDQPTEVSFESAVHLLERILSTSFEASKPARQKLQYTRNHSYLEHGYNRIGSETASSCLHKAEELCQEFLDNDINVAELLNELRMAFLL